MNYLKQIWNSKDLRKKILFTMGILIIYRFLAQVTVPGADKAALEVLANQNSALQILSLFTGGSVETFSIVMMGIGPYINASIIMQLLTVISPKLEAVSKEGESGRRKINSWTRWLTLPLAFLQSYGMILLVNTQTPIPIIAETGNPAVILPIMLTVTAGTVLLVWLGEQISESGIGNGISLLIFASIISQVPVGIAQGLFSAQFSQEQMISFVSVLLITILLITVVVLVNEAQRRLPLTYSSRGVKTKGEQAFFPIRINQAGMIPIIFAVALVSFPSIIGQFMINATSGSVRELGNFLTTTFLPNTVPYLVAYFVLTVAFTFFYVSITFNPDQIAENIQKRGGYIPGVRPGKQTAEYIKTISSRLTLFGSVFLATIAVLPILLQYVFTASAVASVTLLISGAGIIIIVGVVMEVIRQINAELVLHDYKKFY